MKLTFARSSPVVQTARTLQLGGLFDIPPDTRSALSWSVELPDADGDWRVGLVVGPSGSGKSTLAREAWPANLVGGYDWPADKAVVDGFPAELGIKEVTAALSSVGFSTPPAWLRPYGVLSNGEQFRATLARALVDPRPLVVLDEFTSLVDRTVAKVGAAAVGKAVRRTAGRRFVAVTCHADVEEWLCPDWVVEMPAGTLTRRSLRRPPVELEVVRVERAAWHLFSRHHYLDTSLSNSAKCFVALWGGRPVAFASVIHAPGRLCYWREHRTVCLPDFQGIGVGNALSEFVAGVMRATGKRYMSTTGNPAMIRHRAASPLWRMHRPPRASKKDAGERAKGKTRAGVRNTASRAAGRLVAGFEFLGAARPEEARKLGVM